MISPEMAETPRWDWMAGMEVTADSASRLTSERSSDSSDPLPKRMMFCGDPEAERTESIPWFMARAVMMSSTTIADPPTVWSRRVGSRKRFLSA